MANKPLNASNSPSPGPSMNRRPGQQQAAAPAPKAPKQSAGSKIKEQLKFLNVYKEKIRKSKHVQKLNEFLKKRFLTEQEVIGVEIQPNIIRICQAKEDEQGWKIIKLDSINVLNNFQHESLKKNKAVYIKSLKDIFEKNKVTNKSIALSIPASVAIIKTITLPYMPKENLERATRIPSFWQNLVQISENLAEYSIFYRIIKENIEKKEMDVLFIAAKHEELKTYTDISKEAGLEPCVIDVGCFSINNLSKLKSETTSDVLVYLKVGRDENYLQILQNEKPYIYDVFVSENEKSFLNEFLENATFQQRFVSQLKHVIAQHEDKHKVKINKINVISSEANIDKFVAAINTKIENTEITIIDLVANIKLPDELLNNQEFQNTKSSYAVPIGLATRNLDIFADENSMNVSETTNLLPNGKDIILSLKAKFYSKIAVWGTAGLCCIMILIFGLYSIINYNAYSQETTEFNKQHKIYLDKKKFLDDINKNNTTLNQLVKIKESLQSNQQNVIDAFNDISSAIPDGVWIENITIDKDGKLTVTGRSFEERGIITFSKSFEESKILQDLSITSLKTTTLDNGSFVKEFIIQGKMMAGFEKPKVVVDPKKKGKK